MQQQNVQKYNIETFIQGDSKDPNILRIAALFSGFSSSGNTNSEAVILESLKTNDNFDPDYNFLINSFMNSDPEQYTILCKNGAVSALGAIEMFDYIELVLQSQKTSFDILYLANWMDRCDLFTDIKSIGEGGLKIAKTVSPNGNLCLLFSPEGKKKIMEIFDLNKNPILKSEGSGKNLGSQLNALTLNGTLNNITSTPPVVNFDMTMVQNNKEYIKGIQCREVPSVKKGGTEIDIKNPDPLKQEENSEKESNDFNWFWFILILIAILIIAYVIFWATLPVTGSSSNSKSTQKNGFEPFVG
uniref:Uncharacterized protein n=1 Tax=viral metagenome TaxID=1070528 RepID=A0A6C0AFA9_9ZZZZ